MFTTNLTVKASLSSVLMLRLHGEFCLCATSVYVLKFRKTHSKIFEKFLPVMLQTSKQCEILLPLILLGAPYESSIFFPPDFIILKEVKARKQ